MERVYVHLSNNGCRKSGLLADPDYRPLNAELLAREQSLPILNVLGLTRPVRERLELKTSRMLSEESTTTRLPHCVLDI
jgi:hypothetical protein